MNDEAGSGLELKVQRPRTARKAMYQISGMGSPIQRYVYGRAFWTQGHFEEPPKFRTARRSDRCLLSVQ